MGFDTTTNTTQMDGWICLLLDVQSSESFLQYPDEPT